MNAQPQLQAAAETPTQAEVRHLCRFIKYHEQLNYLKGRWLDEREYEDFNEYKKLITKIFIDADYEVHSIGASFMFKVSKNGIKLEAKLTCSHIKIRVIK